MSGFERMGEAMLLAQEGRMQLGRDLSAAISRLVGNLRDWLGAMPTSLPPTEPLPRK